MVDLFTEAVRKNPPPKIDLWIRSTPQKIEAILEGLPLLMRLSPLQVGAAHFDPIRRVRGYIRNETLAHFSPVSPPPSSPTYFPVHLFLPLTSLSGGGGGLPQAAWPHVDEGAGISASRGRSGVASGHSGVAGRATRSLGVAAPRSPPSPSSSSGCGSG